MVTTRRTVLSTGSLTGDPVKNVNGDKIADVKELMIDLDTGRVAYVVVSYGGFMGLGNKLFAIPWGAVRVDQQDHALVIDLNEEVLSTAPGFDPDNWPDVTEAGWHRSIHDHYGLSEPWPLT